MNYNKAIISGHITRDPEIKALPSGTTVATFSIATNSYYTKDGEKKEEVEFHNITVFGKQADSCGQFLKKGQIVLVEGKLKTRNWETDDGVKHYRTEIIAERVQFGPKKDGTTATSETRQTKAGAHAAYENRAPISYPEEEINPDDIPF